MTLESRTARIRRLGALGAGLAVIALLGAEGLILSSCGGNPPSGASGRIDGGPAPGKAGPAPGKGGTAPGKGGAVPPGSTELATPLFGAAEFASPDGRVTGGVPTAWHDRPTVLPVIATRPGWVQVRLPSRPNGSTAWLQDSDVSFSTTPYRIVIDIAATRLKLYDAGRLVLDAPAGVGAPGDPTPTGDYFVAFDEQPPRPNPGYGPFIMVTSAHSDGIADWEGSGDAIIGIHGPLGEDSEIGTTGARISHGCVRLHEQVLSRLAKVPPGTPIDVIG